MFFRKLFFKKSSAKKAQKAEKVEEAVKDEEEDEKNEENPDETLLAISLRAQPHQLTGPEEDDNVLNENAEKEDEISKTEVLRSVTDLRLKFKKSRTEQQDILEKEIERRRQYRRNSRRNTIKSRQGTRHSVYVHCNVIADYMQQIENSNGNFFKSLVSLPWRRENRLKKQKEEEKKQFKSNPPLEASVGISSKAFQITQEEMEKLYVECLFTVINKIGASGSEQTKLEDSLYATVNEAFGYRGRHVKQLFQAAHKEKPPILTVNIVVEEASGLKAKSSNEFIDPYCMLGIRPNRHKPVAEEEDENVPAKFIRTTSVKKSTVNPKWNEKFRFDVDDVRTDILHLDVWDHDIETDVFDIVKQLNNEVTDKNRIFKKVSQSGRSNAKNQNDCFGCVEISLVKVPRTGQNEWFNLEGRTSKSSASGKIRLQIWFSTRESRGLSEEEEKREFSQLIKICEIFVKHELSRSKAPSHLWNGNLSHYALIILGQNALQSDIDKLKLTICKWIAYIRRHLIKTLDYKVLHSLLMQVKTEYEKDKNNEIDIAFTHEEKQTISEAFTLHIEHNLTVLQKHKSLFPVGNKAAFRKFTNFLNYLSSFADLPIVHEVCSSQRNLREAIPEYLEVGILQWYDSRKRSYDLSLRNDESLLMQNIILLVSDVQMACLHGQKYFHQLFMKTIKIPYFNIIYTALERRVAQDTSPIVRRFCSHLQATELGLTVSNDVKTLIMGAGTFELCTTLRELYRLKEHLSEDKTETLCIATYQAWFEPAVDKWMEVLLYKLLWRVQRSVNMDQLSPGDEHVSHTRSVINVMSYLKQFQQFWKQLDWPETLDSQTMKEKLLEHIETLVRFYTELCEKRISQQNPEGSKLGHEMICVVCAYMNNLEKVRCAVLDIGEKMQSSVKNDQKPSNKNSRESLNAMSILISDETEDSIIRISKHITDSMKPKIQKHIMQWGQNKTISEKDELQSLTKYLDKQLFFLHSKLLKKNFDRILIEIWNTILEEFVERASSPDICRIPGFEKRLHRSLDIMKSFFRANGHGISEDLISKEFDTDISRIIKLNSTDTETLIDQFHTERLSAQKKQKDENGSLTVRAYLYRNNLSLQILSVEVISAKNLLPPSTDAHGLSDPYIIVQLIPQHVFNNCFEQQTRVQRRTLNPEFNETFDYVVTINEVRAKGSMLLFTVMDHDVLTFSDFVGEAYMSLQKVPIIENVDKKESVGKTKIHLMRLKKHDYAIMETLEKRKDDKTAQDFVTRLREIMIK